MKTANRQNNQQEERDLDQNEKNKDMLILELVMLLISEQIWN